ncbi:MAG: RHS repeat-associated protein [Candidatus Endobugula sp.]|jgi:RHS repeat-associated protein
MLTNQTLSQMTLSTAAPSNVRTHNTNNTPSKRHFSMKPLVFSALLILGVVSANNSVAYDAKWNGGREDITGHKGENQNPDCKGNSCPTDPCNQLFSPVYTASGTLMWRDSDITFGNASQMGLKRTYNSFDRRAGLFGRGWTTAQEVGIARTYQAVKEASDAEEPNDGMASTYDSVPILMTETGRRYRLTETESGCTGPSVLYFRFANTADGGYQQIYEDSNDTTFYNASGAMVSHYSDKSGVTTYYRYDDQQRLIQQQDSYGFTLNFAYNEQGFVATVTDQSQRVWSYEYNNLGLLTQMLDPDGNSKDYAYQTIDNIGYKDHYLTSIHDNSDDPALNVTWQSVTLYGKQSQRVASYTEADGHRHTYQYSQASYSGTTTVRVVKKTYQVNSNTVMEQHTVDANASTYLILRATNNTDSTQILRAYDNRGKVTSRTDARGNLTRYAFNEAGLRTSMIELADTPAAKTTTYSYWNNTDRIAVMNAYGIIETRYTYDSDLRLLTRTQVDVATDVSRVWAYTYFSNTSDSEGNTVLGKLATIDAAQAGAQDTTRLTYNAEGLLTSVTLPLGQVTRYSYNAAGQISEMTDANGVVTTMIFDSKNRLVQRVQKSRTQGYSYNGQSQLTEMSDALGRVTQLAYNDQNQVSKITSPSGDFVNIGYLYSSTNTQVTSQYYQADDTLLNTRINQIDPDTKLIKGTYLASTSQAVNQYQYNVLEELTQTTATGQFGTAVTRYNYDAEGRLSTMVDALNGTTQFTYDALDRLTQVNDSNNAATQYSYNAWGELLELTSPDTGTTQQQRDVAGNTAQHTNANNQQTNYVYDSQNRLTVIDYQGNDLDASLTYDQGQYAQGRLSTITDGSGSSQYQYDDRGYVTQVTATLAGVAYNTTYTRNAANELIQTNYPSGATVDTSYDSAGRISGITLTDSGATTATPLINQFTWHDNRPASYRQGNGVTTQLDYDAAGRLIGKRYDGALASTSATATTYGLQHQLDNQGNITQQTLNDNGLSDSGSFQYDKLNRLKQDGSADGLDWLFSYDSVGNRTNQKKTDNSQNTDYLYADNSNRLEQIAAIGLQRDAVGNTLSDGERSYQYSAMNRLSQLTHNTSGVEAIYTYNTLGQRVRKQLSTGEDIHYVYGQYGQRLGEYTATGNRIKEYIYSTQGGAVELIAQIDAEGNIGYIHTDHLMTPRIITDTSKVVVWRWKSDAFGATAPNEDPDGDGTNVTLDHRFAGQWLDSESGLYYNYFRYYDPSTGRYLRSDPIGLAGGMNTYGYVYQNPLKYIDPLGLDVIVTLYQGQGANIADHIGIGTTTGLNANQTYGAGPNSGEGIGFPSSIPGHVAIDGGVPLITITIPTTPEQDALINSYNTAAANNLNFQYDLLSNSCVDHVRGALNAGGIAIPTPVVGNGRSRRRSTLGQNTNLPVNLINSLRSLGAVINH